jgi:hypothetical protein
MPEQEARFQPDAWEELIEKHLALGRDKVTVGQVGREAVGIEKPAFRTCRAKPNCRDFRKAWLATWKERCGREMVGEGQ